MDDTKGGANHTSVEIVEAMGEWSSVLLGTAKNLPDHSTWNRVALAFAEGQRIRLGLKDFKRI
ncbi:hypothetical protein [Mesorhizobium sp. L-2-11]|uniref:hypothetical protein n=1 Tax=Mesorhizobium sp. L-2-11 TaxID=2744521 RepID=UPI00193818B3|nr:hypothetical protein [Mesorhizobium sp. L-2-11]BCH19753.1 hypothetical protein MesoLjLa_66040 [Mesorhizobium sp. L-2-11]